MISASLQEQALSNTIWECNTDFKKCYYYLNETMTWLEANGMCRVLDPTAALTSINSLEENTYISSLLTGSRTWLGGNDEAVEGVWR